MAGCRSTYVARPGTARFGPHRLLSGQCRPRAGLGQGGEYEFAAGAIGFELSVGFGQVVDVERADDVAQGGVNTAFIEQGGQFDEDFAVAFGVVAVHGAGKHEFPAEGGGLGLQGVDIHGLLGFGDGDDAPERADEFDHVVPVHADVVAVEDVIDRLVPGGA